MRRRARVVAATIAVLLAVTACSATVDGSGRSLPAASTPSAPSPSGPGSTAPGGGSGPLAVPTCPSVQDPLAKLSYACITDGMSFEPDADTLWPVAFTKTVEASTGWVLEEGSADWGAPGTNTLTQITTAVRSKLVEIGGYGTSPTVQTVRSKNTTVAGVPAHILQTTMTLNPTWAKQNATKVKSEHLWIVALQASATDVTLWYVSVPDLVSQLWPKVPAVIASIKLG